MDIRTDTTEAAAIERRRNLEKQRQARIFNARERTIGVGSLMIDTLDAHAHTHTYTHTYTHTHAIIINMHTTHTHIYT